MIWRTRFDDITMLCLAGIPFDPLAKAAPDLIG